MGFLLTLAMAAAAPAATTLPAPKPGTADFDAQCMLVTEAVSESDKLDSATKSKMDMAMTFYFGRLDASASGDLLKDRFRAAGARIEGQPLGPLLQDCATFMETRGRTMISLGHAMETDEKAAPGK